jgi:hypothetical protein
MRVSRAVSAGAVSALLLGAVASSSAAQERASRGAPGIRVYSRTGTSVVSNYVEPAIEVSENAYVFAVSLDLDGQIQVLHPDFPGISLRIRENRELRLPNFFAGFYDGRTPSLNSYNRAVRFSGFAGDDNDTRGTVIALASRAPFNLDRIESGGDWNISAIRQLIEYRSPASAAQALASYLGANGEPIGRDYMRYSSNRQNYYASNYFDNAYPCTPYASSLALSMMARVAQLRAAGQSVGVVGYDYCGVPILFYGPSGVGRGVRPPNQMPRDTGDSRNRLGHPAPPRSGHNPQNTSAAIGSFPPPRRASAPQVGDVTITAPTPPRRGRDPREILMELQNQAGGSVSPYNERVLRQNPTPPRASTAAMGAEPVRNFDPPVLRAASPPPPPREPPRSPPPSASPAPAPPRTAEPHTTPPANPPPPRS